MLLSLEDLFLLIKKGSLKKFYKKLLILPRVWLSTGSQQQLDIVFSVGLKAFQKSWDILGDICVVDSETQLLVHITTKPRRNDLLETQWQVSILLRYQHTHQRWPLVAYLCMWLVRFIPMLFLKCYRRGKKCELSSVGFRLKFSRYRGRVANSAFSILMICKRKEFWKITCRYILVHNLSRRPSTVHRQKPAQCIEWPGLPMKLVTKAEQAVP